MTSKESSPTDFRPCAVIPVYNHHEKLPEVLKALRALSLHCILVDDGSNETTKTVLHQLAGEQDSVSLYNLSWNQGKGTAVMEGLMRAQQAGFSHAVQIDADGQHDSEALPKLLQTAQQFPEALVSGKPVYNQSVPKSRLYGRKITRFWVCVETLSKEIEDAMIGFRVYPLVAACKLIQETDLTRRMDFDIEVIVRLNWAGIPVKSVPVNIHYPAGGLSHFDAVADNIRISTLHTRLFFGMLKRLPVLARRLSQRNAKHWGDIQERGSETGIRILLATYRLLGHKAFSAMLMPVMAYFFATGKSARSASINYLTRLHKVSPDSLPAQPDAKMSFRHFLSFGHALADRFGAWLGKITPDHLDIRGKEAVLNELAQGQGVVLLVSHFGNIELCRALANLSPDNQSLPVNVLVHTRHAPAFNRVMEEVSPNSKVRLIQVENIGPDTSILLSEMIDRGEIVAIAADRVPLTGGTNMTVTARFLDQDAAFPKGPFVLSAILRCPVFTVFCTRQENQRFLLDIEPFANPLRLPGKRRNEALEDFAQLYASRLETMCKRSPLEWFNFFDFWQTSGVDDK